MKFSLIFDNSNDVLPFEVKYNHELFEFFVSKATQYNQNSFGNDLVLYKEVVKKLTHLQWALSETNSVLFDLIEKFFDSHTDLENYLDQKFLNKLHCDWALSHNHIINIDNLRFHSNQSKSKLGNKLHNLYPDEIREEHLAPIMEKIGYLYPFQEVNMGIHRLESAFHKLNLEFKADNKWQVFDNPFKDVIITNNDLVNFSFGYTYVGRQYYNKFRYFDTLEDNQDHFNYEKLEFAFQLDLNKPETVPFSKEAVEWANEKKIRLVAEQIPIGNLVNLENNLFEYRKIIFRNSRDNNKAKIVLE